MTQVTSNLESILRSLSKDQWEVLLNSRISHKFFTGGLRWAFKDPIISKPVSLTLIRQQIQYIIDTRNRKFTNQAIAQLLVLLKDYKTSTLTFIVESIRLVCPVVPKETEEAVIRSYPTYSVASAIQIGDSKHYTSCLRTGLRDNTYDKDTARPDDIDWYSQFVDECGEEYDEGGEGYGKGGILSEIEAYKEGYIHYATIGDLITEGGTGYKARYRIAKLKNGIGYLLGRFYGDRTLRSRLLTKILYELEHVYVSTYDADDYNTTREVEHHTVINAGMYDYDLGVSELSKLTEPNYPVNPLASTTRPDPVYDWGGHRYFFEPKGQNCSSIRCYLGNGECSVHNVNTSTKAGVELNTQLICKLFNKSEDWLENWFHCHANKYVNTVRNLEDCYLIEVSLTSVTLYHRSAGKYYYNDYYPVNQIKGTRALDVLANMDNPRDYLLNVYHNATVSNVSRLP
jgi:hypothetical protein